MPRSQSHWGKRELNEVSWKMNHLGQFYVYGEVGTGKDSVVMTLAHRSTKPAIIRMYNLYKKYLGRPMADVPLYRFTDIKRSAK